MDASILFDDARGELSPLTDMRASFELRTGALTTQQRLTAQYGAGPAAMIVPYELGPLLATRHDCPINRIPDGDLFMLLNGRWLSIDGRLPIEPNTALVDDDTTVLAALLDREHAQAFMDAGCELPDDVDVEPIDAPSLLEHPWQVIDRLPALLADDLAKYLKQPQWSPQDPTQVVTGDHGVFADPTARIASLVAFDTTDGPIVIDEQADIGAMATLTGPCYIGAHTTIVRHADVRENMVIGPGCKVGGEMRQSIFQGRSNKSHAGFLGHSFVGEWVNLGAGTTTSNLKNTYGEVSIRTDPHRPAHATGMRQLGSLIGDHVRTAIGTRLMTGTCIHLGAMIARSDFAPKSVERFAFLTDEADDRYVLEKFVLVADRMMQRRGVRVTAELTQHFARLYMNHG
jgi:UDP-N-acetylglucosamine diphosphorylase/glucosamine-1-phosphate N-acetyltransferase